MTKFNEGTLSLSDALQEVGVDSDPRILLGWLGMKTYDWSGKTVCEIGSGRKERLARFLAKKIGANGNLTVINPAYRGAVDEEGNLLIPDKEIKGVRIRRMASKIEDARLPENAFDAIIGTFSVPLYLERSRFQSFMMNIARALKQSGTARFYPIFATYEHDLILREFLTNPFPEFNVTLERYEDKMFGTLPTLVINRL